jgi:methionyl-tRNA formyltransferase
MGTPEFAVPSLQKIHSDYEIVSVVTVPDKNQGRGLKLQFSAVKKFTLENNLPVLQPENLKDEAFISEIKKLNPDLIVVIAFRILPKEVFTIPKLGTFNLHASLLPKYRGAAPINWALINGEKETGVTTFFLQEKVDTGNIIIQKKINIDDEDNAGTLHDKLSALGTEVVIDTIKMIEEGNINPLKQDETLVTKAPKIFKEDCVINWNTPVTHLHNFIRGLSPFPVAFTHLDNKIVKIYKSKLSELPVQNSPGDIIIRNKELFVATKDYMLQILELQVEGKKRISAKDFIIGLKKHDFLKFC